MIPTSVLHHIRGLIEHFSRNYVIMNKDKALTESLVTSIKSFHGICQAMYPKESSDERSVEHLMRGYLLGAMTGKGGCINIQESLFPGMSNFGFHNIRPRNIEAIYKMTQEIISLTEHELITRIQAAETSGIRKHQVSEIAGLEEGNEEKEEIQGAKRAETQAAEKKGILAAEKKGTRAAETKGTHAPEKKGIQAPEKGGIQAAEKGGIQVAEMERKVAEIQIAGKIEIQIARQEAEIQIARTVEIQPGVASLNYYSSVLLMEQTAVKADLERYQDFIGWLHRLETVLEKIINTSDDVQKQTFCELLMSHLENSRSDFYNAVRNHNLLPFLQSECPDFYEKLLILIKEKINENNNREHYNLVIVSHGQISFESDKILPTTIMPDISEYCPTVGGLQDIVFYSPWGCNVDASCCTWNSNK